MMVLFASILICAINYNQKHSDCIILLSYISNQEKNMNIFTHA